jgi:hypothetical protein
MWKFTFTLESTEKRVIQHLVPDIDPKNSTRWAKMHATPFL